ncbi:MAG: type II secretion system protein [Phycisphaerales bacterium]
MPYPKASAFTLIELLVSVAIISLMLGILLPALASARGSARSAMCLSHTRQIAEGLHLLADAHGGRLPGIDDDQAWDVRVQEHLDTDEKVFVCPSDADSLEASEAGFPGLSYGWREWFEVDDDAASLSGRLLPTVKRADLVLVFEDLDGRHLEGQLNAAAIDGSARAYTVEDFEANLALPVR